MLKTLQHYRTEPVGLCELCASRVAERAKQPLTNTGKILKVAGWDFTNVIKTTALLADIKDFNTLSDIYKQDFQSSRLLLCQKEAGLRLKQ